MFVAEFKDKIFTFKPLSGFNPLFFTTIILLSCFGIHKMADCPLFWALIALELTSLRKCTKTSHKHYTAPNILTQIRLQIHKNMVIYLLIL